MVCKLSQHWPYRGPCSSFLLQFSRITFLQYKASFSAGRGDVLRRNRGNPGWIRLDRGLLLCATGPGDLAKCIEALVSWPAAAEAQQFQLQGLSNMIWAVSVLDKARDGRDDVLICSRSRPKHDHFSFLPSRFWHSSHHRGWAVRP